MPCPLGTETRCARIERVRVAAPVQAGRFGLTLDDGECIPGRIGDPATATGALAALSALAQRRADVALALYGSRTAAPGCTGRSATMARA
ncbi:hypothetical protein ABU614_06330 [Lysobacter firmicutimachus]|uniref:Uncharacterized protein n=1 Tax=Lysobacter firmicutimachus TaxID=1792846 RepID=A0AAU8MYW3_9GAMM